MKLSTTNWTCLNDEVGVWGRSYAFTDSGGMSNCFMVRIGEGELMAISPPCKLAASGFDQVDTLGKVVAIVAPNGFHHLGLPSWCARYPEAKLYAEAKAAARIAKKSPGLPSVAPISELAARLPEHVEVFESQYLKTPDLFARVRVNDGSIWYSNDVLGNIDKLPSSFLINAMLKWTRSGPGYSVNRLVLKFFRAQPGFAAWIKGEFKAHPPTMVVPGHGAVVREGDVLAQTLGVLEAGL